MEQKASSTLRGNPGHYGSRITGVNWWNNFQWKLPIISKQKGKSPLLVAGDIYRPGDRSVGSAGKADRGGCFSASVKTRIPLHCSECHQRGQRRKINHDHHWYGMDLAKWMKAMMNEVANIKSAVNPQEILFVVDGMTNQDTVNTAAAFNERLDFTGVVSTYQTGWWYRGGAALSIKYTVNKPIKIQQQWWEMDTLDVFYPRQDGAAYPRHGWYREPCWKKPRNSLMKRLPLNWKRRSRKNQFDFEDFKTQLQQSKNG